MRFRPEQHVRRQRDFRDAREKGRRYDCGSFMLWYYRRPPLEGASALAPAPLGTLIASTPVILEEDVAENGAAASVQPSARTGSRPAAHPAVHGPRVGVIASTAAVGGAVERNRAKRRLREVFRQHQALVPAGYDLLLVARHSLNRLDYGAIEQKFIEACRRVFASKP